MSGPIKGYPSKKRDLSLETKEVYITGSPLGNDKHGLDVKSTVFATSIATAQAIDTLNGPKSLDTAGTDARQGDILRFDTGAQATVQKVTGDTIELSNLVDPALTGSETYELLRPNTPVVDEDGNLELNSGPIQFVRDGVDTEVTEDTVTPANNIPLPVKLTSVTGDINITANDLNVQTSHSAANPDSVQIGDGTEILEINASGEATTSDADTHTKLDTLEASLTDIEADIEANTAELQSVNTELDSQTALLTSLDGKDYATETTLNSQLTELLDQGTTLDDTFTRLGNMDGKLGVINSKMDDLVQEAVWTARIGEVSATPTANTVLGRLKDIDDSIASLSGTDFATETTLASLEAKAATETKQDNQITELQAINTELDGQSTTLTSLDGKDFATQTTLAALLTELQAKADLSETQPVSAASLPLPTGAATETTLALLEGKDFATQTTLAALLTELEGKADLSETQPVSAASLPLPTGAATEASLAAQAADIALLEDRLAGALVPEAFNYIELTYVAAGNGEGEIETATYKTGGAAGTTVATLTLAYDANNRLTSVTKA